MAQVAEPSQPRAALHDYRHLASALASSAAVDAPALQAIEDDVAEIWTAYQHSQYGTLARRLPYFIHDCLTATEAHDRDDGQRAHAMTAYAHQLAALFLTKLGEGDLASTAASRGLTAAMPVRTTSSSACSAEPPLTPWFPSASTHRAVDSPPRQRS